MAGFRALWDSASKAFQNSGLSEPGYLQRDGDKVIPEMRLFSMLYSDPITPCFKIFFDFSKPYGLFADESNPNSALAYLKRIFGTDEKQMTRYDLLKVTIQNIKILNQYYDFLYEEIEGLDQVITIAPEHVFDEKESKITVKLRETIDMRVMSLVTQLRHIMYDNERMVEVLPENLRRFDVFVSVFPTGYYNNILYGIDKLPAGDGSTLTAEQIQHKLLPTIDKLCDIRLYNQDENGKTIFNRTAFNTFNNMQFEIQDCMFNFEETAKDPFATVTNENGSEMLKISLVFNFRFAQYSMIDNSLIDGTDIRTAIGRDLQIASALNRATNTGEMARIASGKQVTNPWKRLAEDLKNGIVEGWKESVQSVKERFTEPTYPIGNVYSRLNGDFLKNTIKSTIEQGINKIEDYAYANTVGKVERLIRENTRINPKKLYDKADIALNSNFKISSKTNIKGTEQFKKGDSIPVTNTLTVDSSIGNIYTRKGF